jgi:HK97 family phage major capsid protein
MDANTARLFEINKRKAEIRSLIEENKADDIDKIEAELRTLNTEFENIEKRMRVLDGIVIPKPVDAVEKRDNDTDIDSAEYRSAFLNNLRKVDLTEAEKRALTTVSGSVGAVVPTITQNKIIDKVKEYAPLLSEIELLYVQGNVKIAVEGTTNDAALHTEGATITASADTVISVTLGGYEINKLITVSKSVSTMSIDVFENWLANKLGKSIADKISTYIISGTGTDQPQGIQYANTWGATNSVTVTLAGSLTAANVQTLVGLLSGGYDKGAKFVMSKKTLFSDFMPLQDNAKHELVKFIDGKYYVYGYEVVFDDRVTLHEAFLGNLAMGYVGNLAEDINVVSDFDVKTNSFDYLGSAMFDGKVAIGEAFVKLIKATE